MMAYQFPPEHLLIAAASVAICFSSAIILSLAIQVARGARASRHEETELLAYLKITKPLFDEFYARRKAEETTLTTIS